MHVYGTESKVVGPRDEIILILVSFFFLFTVEFYFHSVSSSSFNSSLFDFCSCMCVRLFFIVSTFFSRCFPYFILFISFPFFISWFHLKAHSRTAIDETVFFPWAIYSAIGRVQLPIFFFSVFELKRSLLSFILALPLIPYHVTKQADNIKMVKRDQIYKNKKIVNI